MTTSALVLERNPPLVTLLERQFEAEELEELLGLDDQPLSRDLWEQSLLGPLRDFLSRPGKELRASLVELCWHLGGRGAPPPFELPLLVEVLHAGSLIVDDIQDGSAHRRGKPALHVTWGVPRAMNAGNWLYFWPARLLSRLELDAETELTLHRAIGSVLLRCHHGQALDLTVRIHERPQREVAAIVRTTTRLKTGCLMELAATLGAAAAGASPQRVAVLARFGHRLGIGLQMLDDAGGLTSSRRAEKGLEDLLEGRPTWPWAWLAEELDSVSYARLQSRAREVLAGGWPAEELARTLREQLGMKGRMRAREELDAAFGELQVEFGRHPMIEAVSREIDRLERSYE